VSCKKNNEPVQAMQRILIAYPAYKNDGMTMSEILNCCWSSKLLIAGSVFACTFVALIVVFLLPETFRTETILVPPGVSDVVQLNVQDVYEANPSVIYEEFVKNLQSHRVRSAFFSAGYMGGGAGKMAITHDFFKKKFDNRIQIVSKNKKGKKFIFTRVRLDGEDADKISEWLNGFIQFVDRYTAKDLVQGVQSRIEEKIAEIRLRIDSLREVAHEQRLRRIVRLKEAITIAKKLGIENFVQGAFVSIKQEYVAGDEDTVVGVHGEETPLYFRGYKALELELDRLQKKANDNDHINSAQFLMEKIFFLEKKHFSLDDIHTIRIDKKAFTPKKPRSPKRYLIISIGAFLGFMLGIFISIIKYAKNAEKL